MKIQPTDKYADREAYRKRLTEKVTRYIAIGFAFATTFFFFIKLLFL
ncbi:MAG: hypothetical protein H7257_06265 [Taibaiella sp.]|nr:hypothetical protein [Taibaiella sp.]